MADDSRSESPRHAARLGPAHLNHALMYGYDHERGGLYDSGEDNKPASCKDKIWWSQAEMLAALTEVLMQAPNATYQTVLKRLLGFVANHMADPSDGVGSTP